MGVKSMRRTIFVGAIHPPVSPAIGQICVFYACRSMSRASRRRTRARTGLLNPTNTCPRVHAQHLTLSGSVGVPELVTDCCSDGLRGPIASDEALPSGPLGLSKS